MTPSRRATETTLPRYQPMLDCKGRDMSMTSASFTRKTFSIVNPTLTCLVVIGFALLMFTDIFICGQHVSDILQPFGAFEYFMVCLTFVPCSFMMVTRLYVKQPNVKEVFLKFFNDCGSVLMHLIFLTILITIFKLQIGIPQRSYFGEEQPTRRRCNLLWYSHPLPLNMDTSFPSFRSSLYSFVITYICLYIDRIDKTEIRSTQQLVIIVLGYKICSKMVGVWENGDSQLADILVGAAIGVVYGAIAIRNMFGTVFHTSVKLRV